MPVDWPLVGRQEELALIEEALRGSNVSGVVLAGEAGVGKTRLAREALGGAASRGLPVAWAASTASHAPIPFGALSHLLPVEIAPDPPGVELGRSNLLRQAATGLLERSEGKGLILGVDDAHLLDDLSAALVHHAASERQIFVIASVRSGERAPDAVMSLWKDGLAELVDVRALSEREVGRLVEAALGSQADGGALRLLWEVTRGNPLLLRELVEAALEEGTLVETGGVWRWDGAFPAAPRLVDVVEARLGGLGPPERAAMEILAVAAPLGETVFESLATSEISEKLQRRGLVVASKDGSRQKLGLSHPLYGEVLLRAVPSTRLRGISRALADAVGSHGARRREDLLRLATWLLDSGSPVPLDLLMAAARRSMTLYDFPLAERFARAATAAGGGRDATLSLVESLTSLGRAAEAQSLLDVLAESAQGESDRGRIAVARASNLFWRMGRGRQALEILTRAESAVEDIVLRDELAATRGGLLVYGGRTREGIEVLSEILHAGRAPPPVAIRVAQTLLWGLSCAGRPEDARVLAEDLLRSMARAGEDQWLAMMWIRGTQPAADLFAGRLMNAEVALESLYGDALGAGSGWVRGTMAFAVGDASLVRGRVAMAVRWLREAAEILRDGDVVNNLPSCLADLAQALALRGDLDGAEAALEEAKDRWLPSVRMNEAYIGRGEAWLAAARGELSGAVDLSLRTAEVTREMGQHGFEAFSLHDAARLGAPDRAEIRLKELSRELQGELVPAFAEHAAALSNGDPRALDEISARFEGMGGLLYAAEASASASAAYREAGLRGSALASSARSGELSEACEGARTPSLAGMMVPVALTRREREVATLAARGLANREIAERLVISVRTVENHLHAVYGKLGVGGRDELESILAPGRVAAELE